MLLLSTSMSCRVSQGEGRGPRDPKKFQLAVSKPWRLLIFSEHGAFDHRLQSL